MKYFCISAFLCLLLVHLPGCSSSKAVEAIPSDLDRSKVHVRTVEMTAERFHFTPDSLHVAEGTLVRIAVKALDGGHGFSLDDFGIDETFEEGETKVIEFFARGKGEHGFHCSHFCGVGHPWMDGTIIIE